jgi:hypothetical protein
MKLYHGTTKHFEIGEIVSGKENSAYIEASSLLELHRPSDRHSRNFSVFATIEPQWANLYIQAQPGNSELIQIYEVEMASPSSGPMSLVHKIHRGLEANMDCTSLVSEYWNPQHNWRFIEYFAPQFEILGEVECPDAITNNAAYISYDADRRKADQILVQDT